MVVARPCVLQLYSRNPQAIPQPWRPASQLASKKGGRSVVRHSDSCEKFVRKFDGSGGRKTKIIGCSPEPPVVGLGRVGFGNCEMNGGIARCGQIAHWRWRGRFHGEAGLPGFVEERCAALMRT